MNVIFLGAPGSGKGTQASMLSRYLSIPAISTGETLRSEVENGSKIGNLAKSYMDSGSLVPDDVVIGIIQNRIIKSDCLNGFILDGFPRNIAQAKILEVMLASLGKKIQIVFNFDISEEILIQRIVGRFSCKKCNAVYNRYFQAPKIDGVCDNCGSVYFESRSDDNEETVKNRLKVYRESTFDLIEFYRKNNLLVLVSAVKSAPLVFEDIVASIKGSGI